MANTMPHSLRIKQELWDAALAKAREKGVTLTAVVEEAFRKLIKD